MALTVQPIGRVVGGRTEVEDDDWGAVTARIELDLDIVDPEATLGLDDFSHIEVVFVFDQVDPDGVCRGARHPRGRTDWPRVGILGQRAKDRPNRIGLTTCEVRAVGPGWIDVVGLDAVDGTPILDVKPHMAGFAPRGTAREPAWAQELMAGYW